MNTATKTLQGVSLNDALAREMHWVRVLNRALGDYRQATTRIGRRMLRSAIRSHIQSIQGLRAHIDLLNGPYRVNTLSHNEMRALRSFAYRQGKQWRFALARKWRAGQIGGTLKDLLDDPGFGGPKNLARVRLAAINHLCPVGEPIAMTKKRVKDRNYPVKRAERLYAWNSARATAGKISHKAAILRAKWITEARGSDLWRRTPLALASKQRASKQRAGYLRHMTTEQRVARLYAIVVNRWTKGVIAEYTAVHRGHRIAKAKLAVEACIPLAL